MKAQRRHALIAAPLLAAALGLLLAAPARAQDAGKRKPNIIILLADDLGYADVGCQGCKDVPTPHIDALARGGVRCTDGYVSCPVCSPTRCGLLTGRYQQRFGFEFNGGGKDVGLPLTERTLADLLRATGYATGAIGKWHLGMQPQFHPLRRGFEEFFGFLSGGHSYLPENGPKEADKNPILRGAAPVNEQEYLTDAFGREAVAFIERHQKEPFFLYVAFNAVHVPLEATDRYLQRFPDIPMPGRRTYAAMLSALDDAVGRIVAKLRTEGLDGHTLIFFLSDNGGPLLAAARNTPLRGQKATVYEGGVRVPYLVRWTGTVPAGSIYSQPVISLDIAPTALAAAGAQAPQGLKLDGVNILPHLRGQNAQPPHDALFWRYGDHHAIRKGKWKLTVPAVDPAGLYDLSTDIAESQDLSAAHRRELEELTRLYAAWNAQLPPPRWPPNPYFEKGARKPNPPAP